MSWVITGAEKTPLDQDYRNVSLLLHGNGANGSTTITDSSPTPKTITANGNAQISTAQNKFGGASIAFDGTGDYLTSPGSTAFDFGTGDFTIETWIYLNTTQVQFANIVCQGGSGNSWYLSFGSNNVVFFSTFSTVFLTSPSSLSNTTWTHVAVARQGTSLKMFINGTEAASATNSTSLGVTTNLFVGFNNNSHYLNGYIDDLRITKGVARYTANFTPPTAPFPDAGPAQ